MSELIEKTRPVFWIQTGTSKPFDFEKPDEYQWNILALAHSLAQLNRYVGHCFLPYSVAQHCVAMAQWLLDQGEEPGCAYAALMHEVAEMVTGDIPGPLKAYLRKDTNALKAFETVVERSGFKFFQVTPWMDKYKDRIKQVDQRISLDEKRMLLPPSEWEWDLERIGMEPLGLKDLWPIPYFEAEQNFVKMYVDLRQRIPLNEH